MWNSFEEAFDQRRLVLIANARRPSSLNASGNDCTPTARKSFDFSPWSLLSARPQAYQSALPEVAPRRLVIVAVAEPVCSSVRVDSLVSMCETACGTR